MDLAGSSTEICEFVAETFDPPETGRVRRGSKDLSVSSAQVRGLYGARAFSGFSVNARI